MRAANDVRFVRDGGLDGVEVSLTRASSHAFPDHSHDYYAIGLMEVGASWCIGRRKKDSFIQSGQIALINPGQVHSGVPAGRPTTYRMIHLGRRHLQDASRSLDIADREMLFPQMVVDDPPLRRALWELSQSVLCGAEALHRQSALARACAMLMQRQGRLNVPARQAGCEHRAVGLARDFLHDRLDDKVTLDELAHAAGLSKYHLLRVFKSQTGLSPHAYHTQIRVERGRELLRSGLSISSAAQEAGFLDQSHFTRTFRNYLGLTPGQYLAAL